MQAWEKLRGVVKRVAKARGHKLGRFKVHIYAEDRRLQGVACATCRKCGAVIRGDGVDVKTIPQCPTLFAKRKEG